MGQQSNSVWLRNGRASRVLDVELYRIQEFTDAVYQRVKSESAEEPDFTTAGAAGAAISLRMVDEIAHRDVNRTRQYLAVQALEKYHIANPESCDEHWFTPT